MDALNQLAIVWAAVFAAYILARKTRLTPVLWYLAMGALLVNLGVLPVEPDPFVSGLGEVGIVLIMFALGFEERTSNFLDSIRKSWGIALFGALAPFVTAYTVADYFFQDKTVSLICGLAMTATAVSLTMVSLRELGLHRTPAATRIMTSAVLDSIASLALVAIVIPLATGEARLEASSIAFILAKAVVFFGLITVAGAWLLPVRRSGVLSWIPLFGRLGIQQVLTFGRGENATLTVLLLALLTGLAAHAFGFHPAVGAYMAGLLLKEEYFHMSGEARSHEKVREVIDSVAFYTIGPVFFVGLGTKLVFDWEIFLAVVPQTLVMTLALMVMQITSAALAARFTAATDWSNAVLIGFGMLGRAELAFVVMEIAYVESAIISTEVFYTLMFTAFWLNAAVPVTIMGWRWWRQRDAKARPSP
ncbi:MAG: cation:proton antiporter [Methyloligellaceae bacterium]